MCYKQKLLVSLSFLSLYFMVVLPSYGQQHEKVRMERALGGINDTAIYNTIPLAGPYTSSKEDTVLSVNLKPFCPTPGDQRKVSACVGFALGYGAMSILQAIQNKWTDTKTINEQAFSAAFIYNQVQQDSTTCQQGISVKDAIELVMNKGNCLERNFHFMDNCNRQPNERQLALAKDYTIKEYAKIFSYKNATASKVILTKQYLHDSIPVIINFKAFECFHGLRKGVHIWKKVSDDYKGTHTMVVIGVNEETKTFEVMNSWGTDWANNGFVKIGFKDFEDYCSEAYIIIPNTYKSKKITKTIAIQGQFNLKKVTRNKITA